MKSKILWICWALPLCLLLLSSPRGALLKNQTSTITVAALEECRTWPNSGRGLSKAGPGKTVPGCWKTSSGIEFHTCRHEYSRYCFVPEPEELNAMLRGEPWTLQGVKRAAQEWDVYEIKAADGQTLRHSEEGIKAWREWSHLGLLVTGLFSVLAAFVHVGCWLSERDKSTQRPIRRL